MQQKQECAKKERLLQFNQHVEELRANLKQDLARKVPATWLCGKKGEDAPGLWTQHVAAQPAFATTKHGN